MNKFFSVLLLLVGLLGLVGYSFMLFNYNPETKQPFSYNGWDGMQYIMIGIVLSTSILEIVIGIMLYKEKKW